MCIATPGAIPTTPRLLSAAPIVPATCVPCGPPLSNQFPVPLSLSPVMLPQTKSGFELSKPESITHTFIPALASKVT